MPHGLQLLDGQLELVEQLRIEQQVYRPDIGLVLGQKIAQAEMLGDLGINVLRSHFDEPRRIVVGRRLRRAAALLEWPVAEVVEADASVLLFRKRDQRDQIE